MLHVCHVALGSPPTAASSLTNEANTSTGASDWRGCNTLPGAALRAAMKLFNTNTVCGSPRNVGRQGQRELTRQDSKPDAQLPGEEEVLHPGADVDLFGGAHPSQLDGDRQQAETGEGLATCST